jgi:hypothetical protein
MKVRYVITTLKPGVDPAAYEKWLREYDYTVARTLPSIISYTTHRIEAPIDGAEGAGWHYIERIAVRDVDEYQKGPRLARRAGADPAALRALPRAAEEHLVLGRSRSRTEAATLGPSCLAAFARLQIRGGPDANRGGASVQNGAGICTWLPSCS